MSTRAPGMDHEHYRYRATSRRASLAWPGNARLAVWIVLYLEYFELSPPDGAIRDPRFTGDFGHYHPDYRTYSMREYGNRIGIVRLIEALDRTPLKVTVAANALALRRYPSLVARGLDRGWEFAAHGIATTQMITSRLSAEQERVFIAAGRDAVRAATGEAPRGWIGQDFGESARTPHLLAEAGFNWCADWPNDDQPYLLTPGQPKSLVSLPYQVEWDDAALMEARRSQPDRWADLAIRAADRLYAEGGRMFCLGLHPWVSGQPYRIAAVSRVLAHLSSMNDIWPATGSDIASHARPRVG